MSMKQVVDSEQINAAASTLRTANDTINHEFQNMRNKTRCMEQEWHSIAASAAVTALYEIFQGNESRSAVLQNYVNLLSQQINPDYQSIESANTKLADYFK